LREVLVWDGPLATFHTDWTLNPTRLGRVEVAALVALSVALHVAFGLHLARKDRSQPAVREQQVVIEFFRPPPPDPPKPAPPPVVQSEKPPLAPHRASEPRVVAKLEPVLRPAQAHTEANDLPALPVGDDPALAMASGTGTGSVVPQAPPTVAPPSISVPPPPPRKVIAAHEGANYLKNPRPAYPELALRRSWEGEVLLRVRVTADGRPSEISIQKSSGHEVLDDAALQTVRGWSFVPARIGSQPIAGWVTVPIVFNLQ
jgi:protein TonB